MIQLLLGGSPCTYWSIAQTKNREREASGQGWELFKNYVLALRRYRPHYFLYENNKSMAGAIREQITRELRVEPILINSALVSAQNRQRLYWTNIPGVKLPEDQGVLLRDILESGLPLKEKGYTLKANYAHAGAVNGVCGQHFPTPMAAEPVRVCNINGGGQGNRIYRTDAKSCAVTAQGCGLGGHGQGLYAIPADCDLIITDNSIRCQRRDKKHSTVQGSHVNFEDGKSQTLSVAHTPRIIEPSTGKEWPVYEVKGGQITIKGKQYPIKLADGFYIIHKLTVTECKRLQTVPDNYVFPVSDTQAYKMLGNGWTVDVIAHILHYVPGITEEPLEVLSMYDGMGCGHLALDKLGGHIRRYIATEIDPYAIKTAAYNFPDIEHVGDAFGVRTERWWQFYDL